MSRGPSSPISTIVDGGPPGDRARVEQQVHVAARAKRRGDVSASRGGRLAGRFALVAVMQKPKAAASARATACAGTRIATVVPPAEHRGRELAPRRHDDRQRPRPERRASRKLGRRTRAASCACSSDAAISGSADCAPRPFTANSRAPRRHCADRPPARRACRSDTRPRPPCRSTSAACAMTSGSGWFGA